jgi:hypothetical protein
VTDPVRRFVEELIDGLRAAEQVAERDASDTGERITLDELIESQGFDPEEFGPR